MYILFHVQCCHRFVDHTAMYEEALVEWARKQAACWLGKYVSDKQKEETPWQAWLRSRVEILDPDVTLTQWVAKNGLLPDGVHTRKVSRHELIVLRALYAPPVSSVGTHMPKQLCFAAGLRDAPSTGFRSRTCHGPPTPPPNCIPRRGMRSASPRPRR